MADKPAPKLSLYANLLNPGAATALSSEPVLYKKEEQDAKAAQLEAARQKLSAAALRFQPTKRAQVQPKNKPKVLSRPFAVKSSSSPDKAQQDASSTPAQPVNKTTLADWTAEPEDGDFYAGQRIRGGRKNKKRKKNKQEAERPQWDDIYDPTRPTSFEEYKHSEESAAEMNEWLDQLYAHRKRRTSSVSSEEDYRPVMSKQFAPPSSLSFAPPTSYDDGPPTDKARSLTDRNDDDDPYANRAKMSRMSGINFTQPTVSSPSPPTDVQTSNPPTSETSTPVSMPPPPPPNFQSATVLSSAPVRYNMPAPSPDMPANQAELEESLDAALDEPMADAEPAEAPARTNRPGQAGFAERLLKKYGWEKGQGLGASGDGITTALSVKVDKRKKKSDAEGGGFRNKGAMGTIIGGKKKKGTEESAGMSTVVVCTHMVDGMDLDHEMGPDGNLVDEIGQECSKLYGRLEQVKVFRESTKGGSIPVFLRFTEPVSALRAVSALQGKLFAGNTVEAKFYDEDLFKDGVFE
ncbi:Diphosphomevalonate decarboxylase [Venturia nashicola]|uniref:Diphosphomevalonate decarboxylase n=1 Tax=Venturia nashicola TaxID=86259 RepID=A0A4Z1P228_9PEZI|nr:Diphosphomevalonate decarboxylase [Venturia nashicola]